MEDRNAITDKLSPWWRNSVILVMGIGFAVLIWMTAATYRDAPPIPEKVVSSTGETIFTRRGHPCRAGGLPQVRFDGKWQHLGTWRLPWA